MKRIDYPVAIRAVYLNCDLDKINKDWFRFIIGTNYFKCMIKFVDPLSLSVIKHLLESRWDLSTLLERI